MIQEQLAEKLKELILFQNLSQAQFELVAQSLHHRILPSDSHLILADQPGELIYIILEGTLKVHIQQEDNNDVILAILGPGDIVGEMSLIDQINRSANVTTMDTTSLVWMDKSSFQEAMEHFPVIAQNLLRILSRRIRAADEHIQALASMDIFGRVVIQLLSFCNKFGVSDGRGGTTIQIHITQGNLADLVGASRKRVNQVIVSLKNQNYISIGENAFITLHKRDLLAKKYNV
jgi:CRP/FNR family transcriptional regulator, cyclic AMP receptor protein